MPGTAVAVAVSPALVIVNGGGAAGNWWEAGGASGAVAVYQPKGAASLAASYSNLANPGTYDAAPGVAPTWAQGTGWTFNGSTQYLTTGVVATYTWTAVVRFASLATTSNRTLFGAYQSDVQSALVLQQQFAAARSFNGGSVDNAPPLASNGTYAIAGKQAFRDGVLEAQSIGAGGTAPTIAVYIGALNQGAASTFCNYTCIALAIYNAALTEPQVVAVSTAMAAL